ncbi:hypothetical protein BAUCODRAFT_36812 [Baudoinia panamericana UAMH 10762]|uniref:SMP domain-containing protein n=1 Tax=Baudoinia panamericana (strain UAMH 10762) TaxID=717646 RepID=M2M9N8_BAUPA|nr:uncharacterized protein BAUCODRAFT_36812 [Baudoinia panamericana UAMH 10762]EMC93141.1 hypothetical protein BAUCODRAFT_36812 [Baudoinia panamericana UAMH 10762]
MSSFSLRQTARYSTYRSTIFRPTFTPQTRQFTTSRTMSEPTTTAGQAISETARAEGGPTKGSTSAQMQSQVGKERNFEQAAQEVGSKMQNAPQSVTSEDAAYLKSREARVLGQGQPPAGSISSDAQKLAAVNEGATKQSTASGATATGTDPADQSARDRLQNFDQATQHVGSKMSQNPEQVTKEEADLLHSREQRAFGQTSKGGVASQAQSLAADNERKGTA